MSRVTAPTKQFSRSLTSISHATARPTNAGAVLSPKYAELLNNYRGSSEHTDSSRGLTTTHRPTPQPSIANRSKPPMQTFHSSPPFSTAKKSNDQMVLPSFATLHDIEDKVTKTSSPRVPILPDNSSGYIPSQTDDAPRSAPAIVAADPARVIPASYGTQVDAIGFDKVELNFAHEQTSSESEAHTGGMLKDLWKGMVEDVMGGPTKKAD